MAGTDSDGGTLDLFRPVVTEENRDKIAAVLAEYGLETIDKP